VLGAHDAGLAGLLGHYRLPVVKIARLAGSSAASGRRPDFLIIGTMKSATTSLFQWLGATPGVALPEAKEPNFFSADDRWARGLAWYASLFPDVAGTITGEASTSYTDPTRASLVAERIEQVVPEARLVCLVREPAARLRSHYRHEVQRGREKRSFTEAVTAESPYVARSRYDLCLEPYVARFGRERLCLVRTEDLADGADGSAWTVVLAHLGLDANAAGMHRRYNATEAKEQFSPAALALFERGWLGKGRALPKPIRRIGRRVLLRDDSGYRGLLATAGDALQPESAASLRAGVARLTEVLGADAPSWPELSEPVR
jgi:hypothetical protein